MVTQRKSKKEFQLNFITKHGPENLTRYQKWPEVNARNFKLLPYNIISAYLK
jgi:hypothetical protein